MVCKTETIGAAGAYEAPRCKVYSITVESVVAASPGNPGDDLGDGNEYNLD